jgi:hypothetical protein
LQGDWNRLLQGDIALAADCLPILHLRTILRWR